jgi:hypothetical protein
MRKDAAWKDAVRKEKMQCGKGDCGVYNLQWQCGRSGLIIPLGAFSSRHTTHQAQQFQLRDRSGEGSVEVGAA